MAVNAHLKNMKATATVSLHYRPYTDRLMALSIAAVSCYLYQIKICSNRCNAIGRGGAPDHVVSVIAL
jgi:hypothetical protein